MPLAPYERIARSLRDQIIGGVYGPGSTLPSVRAITDEEETSKATVEKPLRVLKNEGLIESQPGVGLTVVHNGQVHSPRDMFLRTTGLNEDIRLANEQTEFKHVGMADCPARLAPLLGVAKYSKVINRSRIIKRSGGPVMLATSWYPLEYQDKAPKIAVPEPIPQGTPKYIAEALATTLARGHDRITVEKLDVRAAWDLHVPPETTVMYIENRVTSADDQLIEVGAYHIIPDLDVQYDYELLAAE